MEKEKPELKAWIAISFAALYTLALLVLLGALYGFGAIVLGGTVATLAVAVIFAFLFSRD